MLGCRLRCHRPDMCLQWLVLWHSKSLQRHTSHLLDRHCASQRPEVCVRDPGELLLDWVQQVPGNLQAGVRTEVSLRSEPARARKAGVSIR